MAKKKISKNLPEPHSEPFRLRLPGFVAGDEIGLGDVIKRATRVFGLKHCGSCEGRTAALNRWIKFTG
jgi:hypothetical protein